MWVAKCVSVSPAVFQSPFNTLQVVFLFKFSLNWLKKWLVITLPSNREDWTILAKKLFNYRLNCWIPVKINLPAAHTNLLTVHRSLYCIFWNLVSALPAHSSTYPSTTWNTVLWMAWVKCMCSWSIAVCRESQTHSSWKRSCQNVADICHCGFAKRQTAGKLEIKLFGDACWSWFFGLFAHIMYFVSYTRWREGNWNVYPEDCSVRVQVKMGNYESSFHNLHLWNQLSLLWKVSFSEAGRVRNQQTNSMAVKLVMCVV